MIRLLGGACIACGMTAVGLYRAMGLSRRVHVLENMITTVALLGHELTFRLAPLPVTFRAVAARVERPASTLLLSCAREIESGNVMVQIWRRELAKYAEFDTEICRILEPLDGVLGRYEVQEQKRLLDAAICELEDLCRRRRADKERLSRVYTAVGATVGLFIAIIAI